MRDLTPSSRRRRRRAAVALAVLVLVVAAPVALFALRHVEVPRQAGEADRSIVSLRDAAEDEGVKTLIGQIKEDFCSLFSWSCKVAESSTAASITGVQANHGAKEDLKNLVTCIATYGTVCLVCLGLFCFFRLWFPYIFSFYVAGGESPEEEQAPCTLPQTLLGWVWPTLKAGLQGGLTLEEIEKCAGLDAAMLVEFCHLILKIFALVGLPLLVSTPTTYLYGGYRHEVSGLNRLGIECLKDESPFFWFHALFVWYVMIVTQEMIISAQKSFQRRRYGWLTRMAEPRANTILVQRIPEEHQSDAALRKYFGDLFSDERIKFASVVKRTSTLRKLLDCLDKAKADSESDAHKDLEQQITAERERIASEARIPGSSVNSCSGFVTFQSRRDAQAALSLQYSSNEDIWIVSRPPSPEDVFWEDLVQEPAQENLGEVVGYSCVVVLYLGFVPIVVAITNAAKSAEGNMHSFLRPVFAVIVPTLGLLLFTSFLPTVLIYIFDKFFVTKAIMWTQRKLQDWYFIFQVIFVLLVTLVGSSLLDAATRTLSRPLSLGMAMAKQMPKYSNFYLNYMISQWMANCLEITRYMNLIKFVTFRRTNSEKQARELSEPEDQDYYGIGSRSARWTANALIGLVFCPICPLICLMTMANFLLCKLIYSYLLVFAETRKVDLGGAFWVNQLRHLEWGLWIFWLLMSGELTARAQPRQALLATFSAVYLCWSIRRFEKLQWVDLPFEEVIDTFPDAQPVGVYVQPELRGCTPRSLTRRKSRLLTDN